MADKIGDLSAPSNVPPEVPSSVFKSFRLDGKVAAVSGAGGGIGYQVARAFAEAGANVIIWYNSISFSFTQFEAKEKKD